MDVNINIKLLPCGKGIMQGFDPIKKVQSILHRIFENASKLFHISFGNPNSSASDGKTQN
jgi:hypothetical protein